MSDFVHSFLEIAPEIDRLSHAFVLSSPSPVDQAEIRRQLDMNLRKLARLHDKARELGVPIPPPGTTWPPPPGRSSWEDWRWEFRRALDDLVAACRGTAEQAYSRAPEPPGNGADEMKMAAWYEGQRRALGAVDEYRSPLEDARDRLWRFGDDVRNSFPPPSAPEPSAQADRRTPDAQLNPAKPLPAAAREPHSPFNASRPTQESADSSNLSSVVSQILAEGRQGFQSAAYPILGDTRGDAPPGDRLVELAHMLQSSACAARTTLVRAGVDPLTAADLTSEATAAAAQLLVVGTEREALLLTGELYRYESNAILTATRIDAALLAAAEAGPPTGQATGPDRSSPPQRPIDSATASPLALVVAARRPRAGTLTTIARSVVRTRFVAALPSLFLCPKGRTAYRPPSGSKWRRPAGSNCRLRK
jgi:hypothetical protein